MSKFEYKFKSGDKVRVLADESVRGILEAHSVHTVMKTNEFNCVMLEGGHANDWWSMNRFELVKEEPNVKEFDLHKDTWFIRTPTKEAFKLAQLWAIEQGFAWGQGVRVNTDGTSYYLEKVEAFGGNNVSLGRLGYADKSFYEDHLHKEIKLTFKTVVDTVEYPEPELIETESQKELRILKEQIEQLTQQANKLETTLKGEV